MVLGSPGLLENKNFLAAVRLLILKPFQRTDISMKPLGFPNISFRRLPHLIDDRKGV